MWGTCVSFVHRGERRPVRNALNLEGMWEWERVEQGGAGVEGWLTSCMVKASVNPPPSLVGLRSYSETCGTQGDNSGTPPKKVPQKDQVNTVSFLSCNHFWNPVPVWAAPCPDLCLLGMSWDLCVVSLTFQYAKSSFGAYRLLCFQIITFRGAS